LSNRLAPSDRAADQDIEGRRGLKVAMV